MLLHDDYEKNYLNCCNNASGNSAVKRSKDILKRVTGDEPLELEESDFYSPTMENDIMVGGDTTMPTSDKKIDWSNVFSKGITVGQNIWGLIGAGNTSTTTTPTTTTTTTTTTTETSGMNKYLKYGLIGAGVLVAGLIVYKIVK